MPTYGNRLRMQITSCFYKRRFSIFISVKKSKTQSKVPIIIGNFIKLQQSLLCHEKLPTRRLYPSPSKSCCPFYPEKKSFYMASGNQAQSFLSRFQVNSYVFATCFNM